MILLHPYRNTRVHYRGSTACLVVLSSHIFHGCQSNTLRMCFLADLTTTAFFCNVLPSASAVLVLKSRIYVITGTRLMAFLAGPPDRGQGSVLKRKLPPAPLVPPDMTDITYTSLALGLQPSPILPTHSNDTANGRGIGNGTDPVQVSILKGDSQQQLQCLPCFRE